MTTFACPRVCLADRFCLLRLPCYGYQRNYYCLYEFKTSHTLKTKLWYSRNDLAFFLGIGRFTTIMTVIYYLPSIQSKKRNSLVHIATRTYRELGSLVEIFIDEHTSHGHWECVVGWRHTFLPTRLLSADAWRRLVEKTRNNAGSNVATSNDMAVLKLNWRDMVKWQRYNITGVTWVAMGRPFTGCRFLHNVWVETCWVNGTECII